MTPRARVRAAAWWLLGAGLAASLVIFLTAPPDVDDPLQESTESKKYLHDLEVYGGRANVLQDEFRRWFDGLWHGRSLAGTVACLSAAGFLALRLAARPARTAAATGARLRLVDGRPTGVSPPREGPGSGGSGGEG